MFNANAIRLKACRRRGGLDQAELSKLVGLRNYNTISRFERGVNLPDAPVLIAYELIFDIPVATLLPDTSRIVRKHTYLRAVRLLKHCKASPNDCQNKIEFLEDVCQKLLNKNV